ncbi:phosphatase [Corynebacterium sp. HMSC036D03]|uniref:HAD family hydrolase n=1 Tax=Corynebacterium TaxID=1716 RepID=UPI00078348A0|nr:MULTISPECIES: HAD family phosphatase [Corynebacterium]OFM01234.1 phosphatase [Corynebacterium sp. HMSC071F07]OFQ46011.1 phosphatase [Corynebacterium sp. HMSC076D02]OHO68415.1 phosphatase [Corynebacterium sp. HMSC036D03]
MSSSFESAGSASSQSIPKRPAAIFWDMDGTLTNSEPLWAQATLHLSSLMGHAMTPKERLATVGGTFEKTLSVCAELAGVELMPGDYQRYQEVTFDYVKNLFHGNLEIFPGIPELLRELHADGMPMMVTTNTERYVASSAIPEIGEEFFVDTICGDEVPAGKPAPDMYLEAARRLDLHPADCLVFEDSAAGMRAAVDAGCHVIGLPEDDRVEVPAEVTEISTLRPARHLDGVNAADVYAWFGEMSSNSSKSI